MRIKQAVVAAGGPSQQRVHGKMDGIACRTSSCNHVVLQEDVSSESDENNKVRSRASLPQDSPAKGVITNSSRQLLPLSKFRDNIVIASTFCICCLKI
jgi:hypothetical protein